LDTRVRRWDSTVLEDGRAISSQVATIASAGSAAAALALVTSYLVARFESVKLPALGISGVDIHKPDRPVRAEMGGLAVLVAIAAGSTVYLGISFTLDGPSVLFAGAALTIALTGLVGVADDVVELSQKFKPFLIVTASIPLILCLLSRNSIFIPTIGNIHLYLLYPLVAVPLAVTTSANFSNLLAGFNGLEAGCAAISLGTMALLSGVTGHPAIAVLGCIATFAYVGFLMLNWYPAKIFPGDTGTLMAGAALAALGLASGLEFEAIVLSIPAAMDFALKMMHRHPFKQRHMFGNTRVRADGTLEPAGYPAVVHAFMKVSPITEKELVVSLLAMQAVFASLAIGIGLAFA
jgi:UDP-N-acetylglucosamine--dolichyl-phosphate N-acetylglucosaminephosphotransferase